MDKWMKVTLAVTVPALSLLVLNDTIQGYYGPSRDMPLAYSVIEEEEPAAEAEEDAADEEEAETEVFADGMAEDIASAEDAPIEETAVVDEAPAEESAVADEATTEEAVPAADEVPAVEPIAAAVLLTAEEIDAGEAAARACASCHQFERERNAAGPHLVGLNGRTIGSVDGFRYSRALQDLNVEGRVWDMETLQVWLENPDAFAEGTRMMYKVEDAEERRLIVGWLTQRGN